MSKILIVDDEEDCRALLMEFLKITSRATLFEASDGKEAFDIATAHQIDLFLIDLEMKKIGGLELIKMIRHLEMYRYQPILVITAHIDLQNKEACKSVGATGFIPKPVDFKTLGAYVTASMEVWSNDPEHGV